MNSKQKLTLGVAGSALVLIVLFPRVEGGNRVPGHFVLISEATPRNQAVPDTAWLLMEVGVLVVATVIALGFLARPRSH